jgi:uncharacterized protein (DUF1810 family)
VPDGDDPTSRPRGDGDPYDLQRFVDAQSDVYERALAELRSGRKRTHWMWFVFPQIRGLGSSPMAQRFAIGSPAEAAAYLAHPVLGPRLVTCARALLELDGADPVAVLGPVDAMKLRSSMTLFARVPGADPAFRAVLDRCFGGSEDPRTTGRL